MTQAGTQQADARKSKRHKLPPMYTLVRVRPMGQKSYPWMGHIYDISETGMRLELDQSLASGTEVEVRAMLPGSQHVTFDAVGRVVRLHDDADERGPMRMGLAFTQFPRRSDAAKLTGYLQAA